MADEDARRDLFTRLEPHWRRVHGDEPLWIGYGDGWLPLIDALHRRLARLVPDYGLREVFQKYGVLVHRVGEVDDALEPAVRASIASTLERSREVCETCGQHGRLCRDPHGWLEVVCSRHEREGEHVPCPEERMPSPATASRRLREGPRWRGCSCRRWYRPPAGHRPGASATQRSPDAVRAIDSVVCFCLYEAGIPGGRDPEPGAPARRRNAAGPRDRRRPGDPARGDDRGARRPGVLRLVNEGSEPFRYHHPGGSNGCDAFRWRVQLLSGDGTVYDTAPDAPSDTLCVDVMIDPSEIVIAPGDAVELPIDTGSGFYVVPPTDPNVGVAPVPHVGAVPPGRYGLTIDGADQRMEGTLTVGG